MKPGLPVVVILAWMLFSCSKSSGNDDNENPVITISSPTNGQNFTAGQTIQVAGAVTDNDRIAEMHIHVYNNDTGALLMDVHLYPAAANATFSQPFTAASGVNYKIQIIAKDRSVNEAISTVQVSVN